MRHAIGIHSEPTRKLGLRPATPGMPRLRLADFIQAIPPHPTSADYLKGLSFGLYGNDRFGVCGPTALANYTRLVTARLTGTMFAPTQDDVYDLYRRSGNPNFSPVTGADDNGVNMQAMLAAAERGGFAGRKVLGFAAVDVGDLDELDAAVGIFGGLLLGLDLSTAQQSQKAVWDYVPAGQWGGHAVLDGAYGSSGGHDIITWAQRVTITDNFARHQEAEAWVAILPEHLGSKTFLDGMDLPAFAKAYEAITGKSFPVPIPAPQPPPPPPPSPPVGAWSVNITGTGSPPSITRTP